MKANKTVTVQGLTLNNPTANISSVKYDWSKDVAVISVIFQEQGTSYKHCLTFEMNTNGEEVTPKQVVEFIKKQLPDCD